MSTESLIAFITYAFVTSVTPGPNNTMLLASGLNYGLVRTLPHMFGIGIGFTLMVLGVGAGLGGLFTTWPALYALLRVVGAAYLLWLAWQIATARPMQDTHTPGRGRPFSFWQAAAFQWVNPKAWVMAIGAIATYVPADGGLSAVVLVAVVFALVNAPSVALWAVFGTALRRYLSDARTLRAFNITMALLLVLSLYPLLAGQG